MSQILYICTNYHNLCIEFISTIRYVDMPDVIAGYGMLSDLNAFVCVYYYMFEVL